MHLTSKDVSLIQERLVARVKGTPLHGQIVNHPLNAELRTWLASFDLEFFARFYLNNHYTRPPAPFHRETFREIEWLTTTPGRIYSAVVWPRGFGKTTMVTLATPLWVAYNHTRECVAIVSDSGDQANMQLGNLKVEVESNDRLAEDYGELQGMSRWQEADVILANGVRIFAVGARMSIRGRKHRQYRPDLFVIDDLEKLKTVQSPKQREDLLRWFTRSLMKAGGFDAKFVMLGNFIHHDCLLRRMSRSPAFRSHVYQAIETWAENTELWDEWRRLFCNLEDSNRQDTARAFYERHKEAMLRGARSSWPEAYSYYDLMVQRVAEGEASFAVEMQNDPVDPSRRFFRLFHTYRKEIARDGEVLLIPSDGGAATPLSACKIFAATDPALGKTADADESAIMVCAVSPVGRTFVLEADIKRRSPDATIRDQEHWDRAYHTYRWGIESVQFQAFFASESAKSLRAQVVELPQRTTKDVRIQSLEPDLTNGYVLLCEEGQEALVREIEGYTPGVRGQADHGLDTLEMCQRLIRADDRTPLVPDVTTAEPHEFDRSSREVLDEERWRELSHEMGAYAPPTFL